MDYQEALNAITREREQALVRLGYLEGQAELLRALLKEDAERSAPVASSPTLERENDN